MVCCYTQRVPNLLTGYRCVVSVGHDEYWSAGMRDTLEAWIGEGGNVAVSSSSPPLFLLLPLWLALLPLCGSPSCSLVTWMARFGR